MNIVVTNRTNLNAKFFTLADCDLKNLWSKSTWFKNGRVLKSDAVPSGLVSRKHETHIGLGVCPVIRELENGRYLVSTSFYEVYSEDQTEPAQSKAAKKTEGRKKEESFPSFLPPPSLVAPSATNLDANVLPANTFTSKTNLETTPLKIPPVNNEVWAYVPTSLTEDDRLLLGDDLELAYCVMHLIHFFRVRTNKGKHDWVELSRDYCVERFGGRHGANWYRVRDKMIKAGILEEPKKDNARKDDYGLGLVLTDPRGVPGHLCYGYRLREDLRAATTKRTILTDPLAIKISQGNKATGYTSRRLKAYLQRTEAETAPLPFLTEIARHDDDETGTIEDKVESYATSIRWIQEKSWTFEPDSFSGRIHTNLTNLKRELRPYLRVDDEPLCQVDVPCSQLGFIGLAAQSAGRQHHKTYLDQDFFKIWEQDIYAYLAAKLKLTRNEVKTHLTQRALFSSNKSPYQKHPVKKLFDKEFPLLADYMKAVKNYKPKPTDDPETKEKPYRVLAQKAQVSERKFIIDTVCTRIIRERPDVWINTIHDSILMLRRDAEFVKMIMETEFAKLDLNPKLKVEYYGEE
ncbi:hypothetical protein [Fimbriiglobus ruber]|uniref:Uncharacterized protein n=1 Tax=Fimbriiglobus ruber TaxID=1908690 RepID=A0A225E042_9BACT|nr:hypothetical protein [Fimbriiglobus ruber]OWK46603.1 hypothetical protein FRUB_00302 [Fimbriiglobus ruber]